MAKAGVIIIIVLILVLIILGIGVYFWLDAEAKAKAEAETEAKAEAEARAITEAAVAAKTKVLQDATGVTSAFSKYKNVATGMCIDNNMTNAYPHTCGNVAEYYNQLFKLQPNGYLQNSAYTSQCLDSDGTTVFMTPCDNNSTGHIFTIDNGTLRHSASGKCVVVSDDKKTLNLVECGTTDKFKWNSYYGPN